MSAFIVGRQHIRYLVEAARQLPSRSMQGGYFSWYYNGTRNELRAGDTLQEINIARILWAENVKSVLYRYPNDTLETAPGPCDETYEYTEHRPFPFSVDPVQVLKACHCYTYQSCEHQEWEGSEAQSIIKEIENEAITNLAGYDDAQWEIDLETLKVPKRRTARDFAKR